MQSSLSLTTFASNTRAATDKKWPCHASLLISTLFAVQGQLYPEVPENEPKADAQLYFL